LHISTGTDLVDVPYTLELYAYLSYFSALIFHLASHLASFMYSLGCILTTLNMYVKSLKHGLRRIPL